MQLVVQYLTKDANVCEKNFYQFLSGDKKDVRYWFFFFCLAVYVVNPNAPETLELGDSRRRPIAASRDTRSDIDFGEYRVP